MSGPTIMRLKTAALLASAWLASSGVALGQTGMGSEVTVNPVPPGGGMLLYPGGQYMRLVPPLLEPGQNPQNNAPIHLHMPGKHPARTRQAPAELRWPKPGPDARRGPKPAPKHRPGSCPPPRRPPAI